MDSEIEFVEVIQGKLKNQANSWDDCDIDDQEVLNEIPISAQLPVSPYGLKKPFEENQLSQFSNHTTSQSDSQIENHMKPRHIDNIEEQKQQIYFSTSNENPFQETSTLIYMTDPKQFTKTIDFLEYNVKSHFNFINETFEFIQSFYNSKNRLTKINILYTLRQVQLTFLFIIRDSIITRQPLDIPDYQQFLKSSYKESIITKLDSIICEISEDTIKLQNIIIQLVNGNSKAQTLKELEILTYEEISGLKNRLYKYAKKIWDMNQRNKSKSQNEIIIAQLLMICLNDYKKINNFLNAMKYNKFFDKKFLYPKFALVIQTLTVQIDGAQHNKAFEAFL